MDLGACQWQGESEPDVTGHPFILYFWSLSCPACHVNMPHLQKLRDEYAGQGLRVLSVHRPRGEKELDAEAVQKMMRELGVSEPCVLDNDHTLGDALGVDAYPTYFLFDTDGRLRRHARGNFGVRMIEQALERVLAASPVPVAA